MSDVTAAVDDHERRMLRQFLDIELDMLARRVDALVQAEQAITEAGEAGEYQRGLSEQADWERRMVAEAARAVVKARRKVAQ